MSGGASRPLRLLQSRVSASMRPSISPSRGINAATGAFGLAPGSRRIWIGASPPKMAALPSGLSRSASKALSGGASLTDRCCGACMKVITDGTMAGDQNTGCARADKPGRAGKSQPPLPLSVRRERRRLGLCGDKCLIMLLVGFMPAKAFPCEPLNRKAIEEVVSVRFSPTRRIGLHIQPRHGLPKSSEN